MDWIDMSNYDFNIPVCDFCPCDFYLEVDKNNNYFTNNFTNENSVKNDICNVEECLI